MAARGSAKSSSAVEKSPATTVDPHEEPSAEWGWHGGFPVGTRVAGWVGAFAVFAMLIGNHEGHTEDLWLLVIGSAMVVGLIWDQVRRRTSWRR
ncbi:DUF2631 domain-containing protein [Actinoalloteichus hymeniacidonis]|uniref:DUF2631 family protein n=1 Tax=Actinoalloteichus hymeniacidonis TaxID=340345 RepID=A0AAC9MY38_9PSEU|nr:DUF2631 domain-containing protein [Actinoalloteichus hymeniacidonis]AOS62597.1 putative DUF2631 family protein [Actinoalloteichus hymeniacidonis]